MRFDEYGGIQDLTIERTTNVELIRSIVGHPEIRPLVWGSDEKIPVPIHDSVYHFIIKMGGIAGNLCFMPVNPVVWNPHINILPEYRGIGADALSKGCEWMLKNTPCKKFVAYPPVFNKPMIRVFEKCGFSREGYSPNSLFFNGQMHDRVLMGR